MKNREFKTLVAAVMLASMVVGSVGSTSSYVYAAEKQTVSSEASQQGENTAKPLKDETVYAKVDGSGTVKSVTVSDQLKNISDESEVKDVSVLENIENVKGDETFSEKGGNLVWGVENADICYQGTTTKELPVGIKISYKLDGKEISADELEGKSGHLVMRYTYENKTGNNGEGVTPFLMATGLILDTEKFTNVVVTNGKLVSDGERDMAVGIGLPAMDSILGVEDLDIPDYFEVEADVTEYEAVEGITVATNSVFNELEGESVDSLDDLEGSMNTLQDAANQLVSGSGELREGLDTLLSSSGTLTDGIGQLADGSKQLASGTGTLVTGADAAKDGANTLSAGLDIASEQVSSALLPGVRALDAGVAQMQASLGAQLPTLCKGVADLDSGIAQVADGVAALNDGIAQAADGAAAISGGLNQVGPGMTALNSGISQIAGQTQGLADGAAALKNYVTAMANATSTAAYTSDSWDEIQTLQDLLDSGAIEDEETYNAIARVISSLSTEQSERDAMPAADNGAAQMVGVAEAVANGTAYLNAAMNQGVNGQPSLASAAATLDGALNYGDGTNPGLTAAAAALSAGLNTGDASKGTPAIRDAVAMLNAALNYGDPSNGVQSIKAGAAALNDGINGEGGLVAQVNAGVGQLKDGTSELAKGVDGEKGLASGLNQLSAGAKALASGNAQLAGGAGELNTGAKTLADGIGTLQTGSGALIDGVKQLDDGAAQLNDGMIQFNEDGIQKLVSIFDGDIEGLLDKVNDMLDSSRAYKNFSGISDDMDGEVKFIFISDK